MPSVPQVLYGCLWLHECFSKGSGAHSGGTDDDGIAIVQRAGQGDAQGPPPAQRGHGKVLSEPLSRSITSVRAFSRELSRFGAIIILAYLCEHHPPFPHNKKVSFVLVQECSMQARKNPGREPESVGGETGRSTAWLFSSERSLGCVAGSQRRA